MVGGVGFAVGEVGPHAVAHRVVPPLARVRADFGRHRFQQIAERAVSLAHG